MIDNNLFYLNNGTKAILIISIIVLLKFKKLLLFIVITVQFLTARLPTSHFVFFDFISVTLFKVKEKIHFQF